MSRFVRLAITTPFKGPNIKQRCRNLQTLRLFRTIDENGNEARTMLPNAVAIVAIAIEKQASMLLVPVAARRQLNELPDEVWTKINIEFLQRTSRRIFQVVD